MGCHITAIPTGGCGGQIADTGTAGCGNQNDGTTCAAAAGSICLSAGSNIRGRSTVRNDLSGTAIGVYADYDNSTS